MSRLTLDQHLQQALDSALASHVGVGASAAVLLPDHAPWTGASGTSDGTDAITPDMLFGIASVTKTYVATLVLLLAEDGALDLDDPVNAWLPALPNVDGTATIYQLLNHTSGIFNYVEHPGYIPAIASDPTRLWSPEETIETFVLEPYAAPGVLYHYSNTGYLLLGMIVERATGSLVSAQLRNRIFTPLDLGDTFFAIEETVAGVVAHPWADLDYNGVMEDISYAPRTSGESTMWTAGALYSTAGQVARFLQALILGEVVEPGSLDLMLDMQPAAPGVGYGLGLQETYDFVDERSGLGHDGGTYGYTARMICLPDEGVFVAVLLNHSSASPDDDYQTLHAISRDLALVALEHL